MGSAVFQGPAGQARTATATAAAAAADVRGQVPVKAPCPAGRRLD